VVLVVVPLEVRELFGVLVVVLHAPTRVANANPLRQAVDRRVRDRFTSPPDHDNRSSLSK